jgi:hypothetical protein
MSALQAALPGLSDKYVLENDMIRLVQAPRWGGAGAVVGWGWCSGEVGLVQGGGGGGVR